MLQKTIKTTSSVTTSEINKQKSAVEMYTANTPQDAALTYRDEDFIDVKRRRGFKKKQHLVGTGIADVETCGFEARNYKPPEEKKAWLFVTKVKDLVSEETVKTYISKKLKLTENDVEVKTLHTKTQIKNNKSFLIGVPFDLMDSVYNTTFWPQGIRFERFSFRRGQHFLEKPTCTADDLMQ